jgi:hypothetical protein
MLFTISGPKLFNIKAETTLNIPGNPPNESINLLVRFIVSLNVSFNPIKNLSLTNCL